MTPEKAIEELKRGTTQNRSTVNKQLREALRLGIEALKRHQNRASSTFAGMMEPLPGETEN